MKKYQRKRIGEVWKTNDGYMAEIIDGGSKNGYCTTRIYNWVGEVRYSNLKKGKVKYPFHPSVYGKGYFGVGKYTAKDDKKAYDTWSDMIRRAYDPKYHATRPTYKDVTVCDKWLNFQVFAEWFYAHYTDGFALDKDIKTSGNKEYHPNKCMFVSNELNNLLIDSRASRGKYPVGVYKHSGKHVASISQYGKSIYLGSFQTAEQAAEVYAEAKNEYILDFCRVNPYNDTPVALAYLRKHIEVYDWGV